MYDNLLGPPHLSFHTGPIIGGVVGVIAGTIIIIIIIIIIITILVKLHLHKRSSQVRN